VSDSCGWGQESVKILNDKVFRDRNPASTFCPKEFKTVTQENVESFAELWRRWTSR
jgi:hypothetical protein